MRESILCSLVEKDLFVLKGSDLFVEICLSVSDVIDYSLEAFRACGAPYIKSEPACLKYTRDNEWYK